MSQNMVIVTCYVCRRRKRRRSIPGDNAEVTYQVWLILELCPGEAVAAPEPSVDLALGAAAAERLGELLRESVAEVVAGRVEGMVWRTDDLSEDQVASFVAGLPDIVKTLAEKPLDSLAGLAGVPVRVALLSADVTATLLLKPVLEPIETAVHAFEVAGIVIGLVTGLHPLVITCVKHLAYDELGDALTEAFEQIMSPADARTIDDRPSVPCRFEVDSATTATSSTAVADPGPVAGGETPAHRGLGPGYGASPWVIETAAASPRSWTRSAAVDHERAAPQRQKLPTITSTGGQKITSRVKPEGSKQPSPEVEKLLRAAQDLAVGKEDRTSMTDRANSAELSPGELLRHLTEETDNQHNRPSIATSQIEMASDLNSPY